jgi:hypothetical protein
MERDITTRSQIRRDENTIIWGDNDDLPLRILDAINKSPSTTACLSTVENFIKGVGFSDIGLMSMPVDADGTTLWQLHSCLSEYLSKLESFAVKFTYNKALKITNAFIAAPEFCRFVEPQPEGSRLIQQIKYNPYFGTAEYDKRFSKAIPVYDQKKLHEQVNKMGDKFPGQIYFHGYPRAPYKFYPIPKFWSGNKWIYADQKLQIFLDELLDNGFFQSAIMNIIGDPNKKSSNPEYMKEVTGTDGVKRYQPDKTVGQEFDDKMQKMFSGVKKAGTVMVLWSMNKDQSTSLQAFPTNASADIVTGTTLETLRGITIATEVPAILANLPQQVSSLGSDGASMQKAIEIMQSRVAPSQIILENFYNNILLPNMQNVTGARVKIMNYSPISTPPEIDDKVWEFLNEQEKSEWIKMNYSNIKLFRTAPVNGVENEEPTGEVAINEALKKINLREFDRLQQIVRRFNTGKITYEQARQMFIGYGFSEDQIEAWLVKEEEEA